MTVKWPLASVTVVAVVLVAVFFAVTVAPGTTALVWSVTVPPIAPSVVDCANPRRDAAPAKTARNANTSPARYIRDRLSEFIAWLLVRTWRKTARLPDNSIVMVVTGTKKRPSDRTSDGLHPNSRSGKALGPGGLLLADIFRLVVQRHRFLDQCLL